MCLGSQWQVDEGPSLTHPPGDTAGKLQPACFCHWTLAKLEARFKVGVEASDSLPAPSRLQD